MCEKMLCGILCIEYGSSGEAERSVQRFGACPHVVFWAMKENTAYIILTVPEEKRFWVEYIGEHPEQTFGGRTAELVIADRVHTPVLKIRKPEVQGVVSPCDSNCAECPSYSHCMGCPATVHYKG